MIHPMQNEKTVQKGVMFEAWSSTLMMDVPGACQLPMGPLNWPIWRPATAAYGIPMVLRRLFGVIPQCVASMSPVCLECVASMYPVFGLKKHV